MDNLSSIEQGFTIKASDNTFTSGLTAAVDYRGDITIALQDGTKIEGYVFSQDKNGLDIFPKNSPRAINVSFKSIESLTFSGANTADGTGWDDWMKKKEAERAAIKSAPIQTE